MTDRAYFEITIDGVKAGRLEFGLFGNTVPKTAKNFLTLAHGLNRNETINFDGTPYKEIFPGPEGCTGNLGKYLDYRGTHFHRIIPGFMAQGGDFTDFNGMGGESIYGNDFPDENFLLKHERPFLLSMANSGPHSNGSQFFITFKPTPWLDGKHVVFGEIVAGKDLMKKIEKLGSADGTPTERVEVRYAGFMSADD